MTRKRGEALASRSPILSDRSILHAGEPRKLSIGAKYCIPTVTSLPRGASLFPVLRVPPSSIIGILEGFAVSASQYYGRWTLNVDS